METLQRTRLQLRWAVTGKVDLPGIAAFLVPLVLILYLALSNGGYGIVERAEVGIAAWWICLVASALGALRVSGATGRTRWVFALLAAFAAWTAISMVWTQSLERTTIEVARVVGFLGVFAIAIGTQQGRWRPLLNGVTTGLALICGLAILSRLEPGWFPERISGDYLTGYQIERRLAYPLNYSSGLAILAVMCIPLLLATASAAKSIAMQAVAASALPLAALALWLTASGLAVPVAVLAIASFLILTNDRLPKLSTLVVAGAGSAILFAAFGQRGAIDRGLTTDAAQRQGDELVLILLFVCAGVGLVQAGLGLAMRYGQRPTWLQMSAQARRLGLAGILIGVLGATVALVASGQVSDRWAEFKASQATPPTAARGEQLLDFSSSGRYQFWEAAVDANGTDPLIGIGGGTYEYWVAENGTTSFARDAHSLYLESLAELGIIGMLLISGFVLSVLAIGAYMTLRAPPRARPALAGALAACVVFAVGAGLDWVWELGVLPIAFLVLAAVVVGGAQDASSSPQAPQRRRLNDMVSRGVMVALSLVAIAAIAVPLATHESLERSRAAVAAGDTREALDAAQEARGIQPFAASPYLQEALILEQMGSHERAVDAARSATEHEPTNWRTWLILARIQAEAGQADAALVSYERARTLNPRSQVFAQ